MALASTMGSGHNGQSPCYFPDCVLPGHLSEALHSGRAPEWVRVCRAHLSEHVATDTCKTSGCTARAHRFGRCGRHQEPERAPAAPPPPDVIISASPAECDEILRLLNTGLRTISTLSGRSSMTRALVRDALHKLQRAGRVVENSEGWDTVPTERRSPVPSPRRGPTTADLIWETGNINAPTLIQPALGTRAPAQNTDDTDTDADDTDDTDADTDTAPPQPQAPAAQENPMPAPTPSPEDALSARAQQVLDIVHRQPLPDRAQQILAIICKHPGIPQGDLCTQHGIPRGSVSGPISMLVTRGLVRRVIADGQPLRLFLTDAPSPLTTAADVAVKPPAPPEPARALGGAAPRAPAPETIQPDPLPATPEAQPGLTAPVVPTAAPEPAALPPEDTAALDEAADALQRAQAEIEDLKAALKTAKTEIEDAQALLPEGIRLLSDAPTLQAQIRCAVALARDTDDRALDLERQLKERTANSKRFMEEVQEAIRAAANGQKVPGLSEVSSAADRVLMRLRALIWNTAETVSEAKARAAVWEQTEAHIAGLLGCAHFPPAITDGLQALLASDARQRKQIEALEDQQGKEKALAKLLGSLLNDLAALLGEPADIPEVIVPAVRRILEQNKASGKALAEWGSNAKIRDGYFADIARALRLPDVNPARVVSAVYALVAEREARQANGAESLPPLPPGPSKAPAVSVPVAGGAPSEPRWVQTGENTWTLQVLSPIEIAHVRALPDEAAFGWRTRLEEGTAPLLETAQRRASHAVEDQPRVSALLGLGTP